MWAEINVFLFRAGHIFLLSNPEDVGASTYRSDGLPTEQENSSILLFKEIRQTNISRCNVFPFEFHIGLVDFVGQLLAQHFPFQGCSHISSSREEVEGSKDKSNGLSTEQESSKMFLFEEVRQPIFLDTMSFPWHFRLALLILEALFLLRMMMFSDLMILSKGIFWKLRRSVVAGEDETSQ